MNSADVRRTCIKDFGRCRHSSHSTQGTLYERRKIDCKSQSISSQAYNRAGLETSQGKGRGSGMPLTRGSLGSTYWAWSAPNYSIGRDRGVPKNIGSWSRDLIRINHDLSLPIILYPQLNRPYLRFDIKQEIVSDYSSGALRDTPQWPGYCRRSRAAKRRRQTTRPEGCTRCRPITKYQGRPAFGIGDSD